MTTATTNATLAERHLKRTEGETSKVGSVEEKFNGPNDERFSDVELDFGIGGDKMADNGWNKENIGVHNKGMCNAYRGGIIGRRQSHSGDGVWPGSNGTRVWPRSSKLGVWPCNDMLGYRRGKREPTKFHDS